MSMNFYKLVGGNNEQGEDADRGQGGAQPEQRVPSRQRTLEADGKRERSQKLEAQPQDKAGRRKPPLGSSRRSGSRKRMKEAQQKERKPDPEELGMKQIVEQLQEEAESKASRRKSVEKDAAPNSARSARGSKGAGKKKSAVAFDDSKAKEDEADKSKEEPEEEQVQYQAYVRQTWDISRFINADGTPQFDALLKAPAQTQKSRGPLEFREPAISKCWEQFNDFYIAFIQDIDHFYDVQDTRTKEKQQKQADTTERPSTSSANSPDFEEEEPSPEIQHLRNQLAKYRYQITNVPEISQNILGIIRALKEEDKQEMQRLKNQRNGFMPVDVAAQGAMGENLEYFIENRVIETLAAYAMTDQPQGFFKFLLGAIEDLISSVSKQNNILSHISVNQSIRQILKTIYDKLLEIPFTDSNTKKARRPDEKFVLQQRPRVIFYTIDILKFIYTLTFKVQNEVHLIRLLFCKKDGLLNRYGHADDSFQELTTHEMRLHELRQYQQQADPASGTGVLFSAGGASPIRNQNIMEDIVSYDICLPFHILVYYLKNAKCMLSECEKNFLDDVIVMSFNSLCIDAKFVCYLINESDFIEIVMSEIATSLAALPLTLQPIDELGNYNTVKQLENMNPRLLSEQLQDLITNCKLLNQIFETLNLQARRIFDRRVKKEDGFSQMQCIAEIQKAFLREYVQIVLINTIQSKLLTGSVLAGGGAQALNFSGLNELANLSTQDTEQIRTTVQYLIEILDAVQARPFALVTFAFLNNSLKTNLDRYLSEILQESQRATTGGSPAPGLGLQVNERYDYQKRTKANLQIIDELNNEGLGISQSEDSFAQGVTHAQQEEPSAILNQTNELDVRDIVERLYPERQTSSRFSLKNPNARFTQTHDMLRKTIKEYRELGKIPDAQLEDMEDQDGFGYRGVNQKEILATGGLNTSVMGNQRGLNNAMLFQKQGLNTGSGALSSNLFACESLVNQTLSESLATHNNIDLLFTKAQNLEAQAKLEDDFVDHLQLQQFKNVTFHGMMLQEVRLQAHNLVFRSQSDVSMIMLKLFSVLIKSGGIGHFIKENFKIQQTIFRTTDDISHLNDKYRLMLPVTSEQRQQSLADFPDIIYNAVGSASSPESVRNLEKLDLCMGLLGHQLLHRQLIQLYFSNEYTIRLRLKVHKEGASGKAKAPPVEKKVERTRLLAAAGVGGTDSGTGNRLKELRAQRHGTPSTNVTANLRGGTGGSTGDTGGISDFEHGLQGSSPLRSKKSAAAAAESFEEDEVKVKQSAKPSSRPGSLGGILSGMPGLPGKSQIYDDRAFSHVWEMFLQKLLQFMDNTPNENALLCQTVLQLFEIPGQDQLLAKPKRHHRKKADDKKPVFETVPLELLQWWLYATEFDTKVPRQLSQRQQKQIDEFKQSFDALRRKYGQSTRSKQKAKKARPLNTNQSSQKKGSQGYDGDHAKLNIITILAKVKSHIELYEDDEKVRTYKQVLLEDLKNRATKKKGKAKRRSVTSTAGVAGTPSTGADDADEQPQSQARTTYERQLEELREKQRKKLFDELSQPFIFRDRNLISAENCLIFNEFYEKLWQQLSVISLAIHQIYACGPSQQEALYEKEFCQEGSIVCRSEEQREMLVCRREARLDIWNGKIDNINESLQQESGTESYSQSFLSSIR